MISLRGLAAGAVLAAGLVFASQPASAASVINTNGGDGFSVPVVGGFDLFGADNGVGDNITAWVETAPFSGQVAFNWTYTTNDCCGSFWDPAGWFHGIKSKQLSPAASAPGAVVSGVGWFHVTAGEQFGFYVDSLGSVLGRADILITEHAPMPEPATWVSMILGFGMLGAVMRRRRVSQQA